MIGIGIQSPSPLAMPNSQILWLRLLAIRLSPPILWPVCILYSTNFISNYNDYIREEFSLPENALPVTSKKNITIIKAGSHWIFKHFFDDTESFRELADYYDKDVYRFVLKTPGERNLGQKLLEQRGFDV